MNLKKYIRSKTGSYIVEAALTLPVFIICVLSLALIINIITICENICFVVSEEMRDMNLRSYWEQTEAALPVYDWIVEERVYDANPKLTEFRVKNLDYLYHEGNIDDLTGISVRADFTVDNPLGVYGEIRFEQDIVSRGFTGARQENRPLDASEFMQGGSSRTVVVFPKYGIRYHVPSCRYVKQEYEGDEYRLEMEAEDALRKGYTPCLVCGGGNNE